METRDEIIYLYWLWRAPFLGAVSIRRLFGFCGCFREIYNMEETELSQPGLLSPRQAKRLCEWKSQLNESQTEYEKLPDKGLHFVSFLDTDYPQRLQNLQDAPAGLCVLGKLPEDHRPSVAIVGSRGSSAYGEQLTEEYAAALAAGQVQIISGLALGIDASAHRGALRAGGDTFAVLGCGANFCYPSLNYPLYEAMKSKGGVLSEFPPDTKPLTHHFPMRNRIISGLSDAVLVVEAKERSGSLITVGHALDQGREVFAVPGRVTDHLSAGCNQLIQQGAHMAISPNDILDYLGVKYQKGLREREKSTNGLAKKEKMLYSCLDFKPKHLDEIIALSGLSPSECMGILLELELSGYVYCSASHYYGKKL